MKRSFEQLWILYTVSEITYHASKITRQNHASKKCFFHKRGKGSRHYGKFHNKIFFFIETFPYQVVLGPISRGFCMGMVVLGHHLQIFVRVLRNLEIVLELIQELILSIQADVNFSVNLNQKPDGV